jgi:hypothetical protein
LHGSFSYSVATQARERGLKSPLKMLALKAACDVCPAREALHMALTMAMTRPFALAGPGDTIRPLADVRRDDAPDEGRYFLAEASAELAELVLLDIVQRHLQRVFALRVWLAFHLCFS